MVLISLQYRNCGILTDTAKIDYNFAGKNETQDLWPWVTCLWL